VPPGKQAQIKNNSQKIRTWEEEKAEAAELEKD
jgi:hypothetical protein